MANSPSHKFGQIIGDLLEEIMLPYLQEYCDRRGLYLDKKGKRGPARSGKKVTWQDKYGNDHDLDFVIEKGGTSQSIGRPLAFIETAWRRYTKHSRNKTQEIQGAILPIAERYWRDKPFLGSILAGIFTEGSLTQMASSGFEVMLFPYESIIEAFLSVNINASFDEDTPDEEFSNTIKQIQELTPKQRESLKLSLIQSNHQLLDNFIKKLEKTLDRKVTNITVIPLHGLESTFATIEDANLYIDNYDETSSQNESFMKYEIIVKYSNGDRIDASFNDKKSAKGFLKYIAKA